MLPARDEEGRTSLVGGIHHRVARAPSYNPGNPRVPVVVEHAGVGMMKGESNVADLIRSSGLVGGSSTAQAVAVLQQRSSNRCVVGHRIQKYNPGLPRLFFRLPRSYGDECDAIVSLDLLTRIEIHLSLQRPPGNDERAVGDEAPPRVAEEGAPRECAEASRGAGEGAVRSSGVIDESTTIRVLQQQPPLH